MLVGANNPIQTMVVNVSAYFQLDCEIKIKTKVSIKAALNDTFLSLYYTYVLFKLYQVLAQNINLQIFIFQAQCQRQKLDMNNLT